MKPNSFEVYLGILCFYWTCCTVTVCHWFRFAGTYRWWKPECNNTKSTIFRKIFRFLNFTSRVGPKNGQRGAKYYLKIAAKVRYSGVYFLLIVVQRSLHSRLWLRFILRTSRISDIFLPPWILKTLCHPPGFKNPYATLFYATPQNI